MGTPTMAADPGASEVGGHRGAHRAPLWPGLALAMAGSIAFSGKAIIVKLAYRYGVDAVTLIMYRMLFALPLFALLAWWAGRGRPPLARRDWIVVTGLGFSGYYLASFLDFVGLQYITASLERLILYLNPTLVLAIGVIAFAAQGEQAPDRRPRRQLLRRPARVRPRAVVPGARRRARRRARVRQRDQLRDLSRRRAARK